MAKSGINKQVAKKAYNNVKKDLQLLEQQMNKLVEDVEKMNANAWYGDKPANQWYTNMVNHYGNTQANSLSLVKFYSGVSQFQDRLQTVFKKASTKDITF